MDDKTYRRMFSPGSCSCGKSFRSMAAEAVHRHNFPALCQPPKKRRKAIVVLGGDQINGKVHDRV